MKIVLIGAGRIGSTVAFCLAKAGHETTVVARGARLEALTRDRAIVTVDGERAEIEAAPALDRAANYDLAIVTVPEHQIGPLLPDISACQAKTVLLMFNTFRSTDVYRSAVGEKRFAFGFPNMTAFLVEQRLRFRVDGPGMVTTLSSPNLAKVFKEAGMPSAVEDDMDAFLKTHVAMVVPLFLASLMTWQRKANLTWAEASLLDVAWTEGFNLVRSLGHELKPRSTAIVSRMPSTARKGLLWMLSRSRAVKDLGEFGPMETRALIDTMVALAPNKTHQLRTLRP